MAWNLAARHCESKWLIVAFARNDNFNNSAFLTLEPVRDFTGRQPIRGLVIHTNDYVARTQAGVVGRSSHIRRHNNRVIVARGDDHADAVIPASLVFAEQRKLPRIKEIRMRV